MFKNIAAHHVICVHTYKQIQFIDGSSLRKAPFVGNRFKLAIHIYIRGRRSSEESRGENYYTCICKPIDDDHILGTPRHASVSHSWARTLPRRLRCCGDSEHGISPCGYIDCATTTMTMMMLMVMMCIASRVRRSSVLVRV